MSVKYCSEGEFHNFHANISKIFSILIITAFLISILSNNSIFDFESSDQNDLEVDNTTRQKYFVDPNLKQILYDSPLYWSYIQGDVHDIIISSNDISEEKRNNFVEVIKDFDGYIVDKIPELNYYRILISDKNLESFSIQLNITDIQSKFQSSQELLFTPNDPLYPLQWHLPHISLGTVWDNPINTDTVLVAIIDSGVDYSHPDLSANYDSRGYDWFRGDTDPMDEFGHGTHVAGIISAEFDNNIGVSGIGNIKYFSEKVFGDSGTTGEWYLAQGVIDAVNKGANITSNSWGGEYSSLIHDAFKFAHSKGVINIASAGNDNSSTPTYPAALPEVISVAATTQSDTKADFSNYGSTIDLAAPGVNIYSTLMNNNYGTKSGTSMSAPIISGIVALMLGEYGELLDHELLKSVLPSITDDLGTVGYDQYFGHGIINASKALDISFPPIIKLQSFKELQLIEGQVLLNYSVNEQHNNLINLTLNLLANGSLVQNLQTRLNLLPNNYNYSFDSTQFVDGSNYSILINASTGLFSSVKATSGFTIDNIKNSITNVTLLAPLPNSVHNDSLLISWQVEDIDGPPHQTEITLHWDIDQSKSFGIVQVYSTVLFISDLHDRSDYWLELNVSDGFSYYTINSNFFIINNPAHQPSIQILYPVITNTTLFMGNISIGWQQSDLNGDFLNTSLSIKQNQVSWLIASNQTSTENVVEWSTYNVPDGIDYQFDFLITDGVYHIHYLSGNFSIDNPQIPEINIISPTGPNPISKGLLNVTWDITDLDGENITGVLEYRLLSNPSTWIMLRNVSNTGSFIWDTGQITNLNQETTQLRLNITDGYYHVLYPSSLITLYKPHPPVTTVYSPYQSEVVGVINFSWNTHHPDAKEYSLRLVIHNLNTSTFTDMVYIERKYGYVTKTPYIDGIAFYLIFNTPLDQDYYEYFDWGTWDSDFIGYTLSFLLISNDGYFNITTNIGTVTIGHTPFEVEIFTPSNTSSYIGRYWEPYYSITGTITSYLENPSRIYNAKVTIEHEDNRTKLLGYSQIEAYPENRGPINPSNFSIKLTQLVDGTFYGKVRYILEFSDWVYTQTYVTEYFDLNVNHPTIISDYNIHDICIASDCLNYDNSPMYVYIQDPDNHPIIGEVILEATFENQRISLENFTGSQNFKHFLNYNWQKYKLNGEYLLIIDLKDNFSSLDLPETELLFNHTLNFRITEITTSGSQQQSDFTNQNSDYNFISGLFLPVLFGSVLIAISGYGYIIYRKKKTHENNFDDLAVNLREIDPQHPLQVVTFCSDCGQKTEIGDLFCAECGKKLIG